MRIKLIASELTGNLKKIEDDDNIEWNWQIIIQRTFESICNHTKVNETEHWYQRDDINYLEKKIQNFTSGHIRDVAKISTASIYF